MRTGGEVVGGGRGGVVVVVCVWRGARRGGVVTSWSSSFPGNRTQPEYTFGAFSAAASAWALATATCKSEMVRGLRGRGGE